MKALISVAVFLILTLSLPTLAAYDSKDALIQEIMRAGYGTVLEVGAHEWAKMKFHTPNQLPMTIEEYVAKNRSQRLTDLDIKTSALVRATFDAYIVGESLICYDFNNIRRRLEGHARFSFCLVIPVPVAEVLSKIKALPKQADPGAATHPGTPANN